MLGFRRYVLKHQQQPQPMFRQKSPKYHHCNIVALERNLTKVNELHVHISLGYLHLGGLRTALYNYIFAKANNGTFIVRIEDTDQSRLVPDAIESLFNDLDWAGINPDESVLHGGHYGPYVQSERLDIYRREVKKLLENGSAYYCFCTGRRLELLRKDAIRANETPKYDNRCRHLTPVQVAEKLANHDPMCIRCVIAL